MGQSFRKKCACPKQMSPISFGKCGCLGQMGPSSTDKQDCPGKMFFPRNFSPFALRNHVLSPFAPATTFSQGIWAHLSQESCKSLSPWKRWRKLVKSPSPPQKLKVLGFLRGSCPKTTFFCQEKKRRRI